MQHQPRNGHQAYEAVIYNKDVRALIKDNKAHNRFAERWADGHVQNVEARSEGDARRQIAKRYPPEDGFVVSELVRRKG